MPLTAEARAQWNNTAAWAFINSTLNVNYGFQDFAVTFFVSGRQWGGYERGYFSTAGGNPPTSRSMSVSFLLCQSAACVLHDCARTEELW